MFGPGWLKASNSGKKIPTGNYDIGLLATRAQNYTSNKWLATSVIRAGVLPELEKLDGKDRLC